MLDAETRHSLTLLISQSQAEAAAFGMLRFAMACSQSVFLHENDLAIIMLDCLIAQSRLVENLATSLLAYDDVTIRNRS